MDPGDLEALRGRPWPEAAAAVARHLLADEIPADVLDATVKDALDFPMPLQEIRPGVFVLELFHGPTLAFKDVGARFMARSLAGFHDPGAGPLTVLAATSGDTGSAVARAFLGLEGTRVVVLFPEGQVSRLQESQFTTLGGNVLALAVQGTFDDCQRLAKEAFADEELRDALLLTSANSINVGRLIPQIFYYFQGWAALPGKASGALFSVPSGNFGNLTAGLMARRLGLPGAGFVAATNANDVVPAYLRTGRYRARPSVRTISNAMDVGAPSNFARIMALYGGDGAALGADVTGSAWTDDDTRACIRRVHEAHGRVIDPHTAVGLLGLEKALEEGRGEVGIVLATAHPAKFAETVEPLIGRSVPLPPALEECLRRERRVTRIDPRYEALRGTLLDWS